MKNRLLIFIFILQNCILISATNYNFRTIRVDDGLSENSVYSILQDSTGYIWFGTKDGLNRYDGREVKIFRKVKDTPCSLGNNFVRSLCQPDSTFIWIGTDVGISVMNIITEKITNLNVKTATGTSITSAVNAIVRGQDKLIWIATMHQGLFCYNQQNNELIHIIDLENNLKATTTVWSILEDKVGDLWIGTREGLLHRKTNSGEITSLSSNINEIGQNEILTLMQDGFGFVWAGTWSGGIQLYNSQSKTLLKSYFTNSSNEFISHIRSIYEYSINEIFIGSDDGLYLFDRFNESLQRVDTPNRPNSLSDQNVYSIIEDREGGIWIGTYFGGVNYLHPNHLSMESYSPNLLPNSLTGKAVSQFCEDESGNIFIATEDGGLNYFDIDKKQFTNHSKTFRTTYHNLHALLLTPDLFFVGTFSRGLDVFDRKTMKKTNYQHDARNPFSLQDNCIFSLYRCSNGTIYVGTPMGLQSFNIETGKFNNIDALNGYFVYDIKEDMKGNIWVASYNNGVVRYIKSENKWVAYANIPSTNMNDVKLISIFISNDSTIWFTSQGNGIYKYLPETNNFDNITTLGNWNIDVVYGMLEDEMKNFWISTNSGLFCYNPDNPSFTKHYTKADGLQSNEFNFKSIFRTSRGKFFFGGVNGFNSFYPERLSTNMFTPNVRISAFNLLKQSSNIQDSTILYGINQRNKIELPYDQASFRISFVALSFLAPDKNKYAYKLEGKDDEWLYIDNRNEVTFAGLAPGEYTFQVIGSNNEGLWPNEPLSLKIIIKPPFWLSFPAKILYTILILGIIFIAAYRYQRRNKRKHKKQLELFKAEQEKLATKSKIDFFTTIAHEIRTPLTLINGSLEEIISSGDGSSETKGYLHTINLNCNQLTTLINQLMDFRKMDSDKYAIHQQSIELKSFICSMMERFKPYYKEKEIKLDISYPTDDIWITTDPDALNKIVSNLISNAIKFTKNKVDVQIGIDSRDVFIEVSDNGIGISENNRKDVFKPFYQMDSNRHTGIGTGVGLYIVKYLTDSLHANIELTTSIENGACFRFTFHPDSLNSEPKKCSSEMFINSFNEQTQPTVAVSADKLIEHEVTILVIDDNIGMCEFIERVLHKDFRVLLANNATEAEKILEQEMIDIIISDIMMPQKNGVQLTFEIRNNLSYSHIPIVLLSAKTDNYTKSEGLQAGADIFIEKPFSPSVLISQLRSLVENKRKRYEAFKNNPFPSYDSLAKNKRDEEFITKLNLLIEENITDTDFSVESMCDMLFMSRSNLQRKIKQLSGLSPGDYLRNYRLNKAYCYLLENRFKINEIAFETGFSSASYFTKCFAKHYGMTPSQALDKHEADGA